MSAVPTALINDPWPLHYKELFIGLLGNSAEEGAASKLRKARSVPNHASSS
jgi:hypothetical protein